MTKVYQTRYAKGQGNCLTACVASVLDVEVSSLPEFCIDGEWFERLRVFCEENGFALLYWKHDDATPVIALGAYVIVLLDLEGHEELHTVVGKTELEGKYPLADGSTRYGWRTAIVHDPNEHGVPPIKGPSSYLMIGKQ